MKTPLILTQAQAEAVYSAFLLLANIGANQAFRTDSGPWEVRSRCGWVIVEKVGDIERYNSWDDFAIAYGLQQG